MRKSSLISLGILASLVISACTVPITEPPSEKVVEEIDIPVPVPAVPPPAEKPCTKEYRPVCGMLQVQCITTPCPPIATTFSNRCMAENAGATDIVEGTCEDEAPAPETSNLEETCLASNGTWLPGSNECEWISKATCENLGGTYNECASACRNDPNAEICTLQCIQVCQF